ncbi:MAG: endonuclease/exonuclease/phosphatase family protein, partial [Candidatus Omnitrophica bacterium]|nr:endonuclease/exonuclease/phosphatase family protein [Candidatus Omnitrophota bacterium]
QKKGFLDWFKKENPDILCLQDFYHSISQKYPFITIEKIIKAGFPYFQIHYTHTVADSNFWGIATFSKYPLIKGPVFEIDSIRGNAWIYSDACIGKDTIRIFNLHGASVKLKHLDYVYIEKLLNEKKPDYRSHHKPGNEKIFEISQKVIKAMKYRQQQVDTLIKTIQQTPYPIILCCDLNDIPNSYVYEKITHHLHDAYTTSGTNGGTTYLGPIPFLRIDYIFFTPHSLVNHSFHTLNYKLSDHKPITACFQIQSK